jgi:hypothetical protein
MKSLFVSYPAEYFDTDLDRRIFDVVGSDPHSTGYGFGDRDLWWSLPDDMAISAAERIVDEFPPEQVAVVEVSDEDEDVTSEEPTGRGPWVFRIPRADLPEVTRVLLESVEDENANEEWN